MLRITVGRGDEDYMTVQEAINAVPYNTEAEIIISAGVYREKIFSDKNSLRIKGLGGVYIVWDDGAYEIVDHGKRKRGTFRSYTAFFSGESLQLENITIVNSAGSGSAVGQAVALYLDVASAVLENVSLISFQDTLFLAPLPDEEREKNGFYGPRHLLPRRRTRTIIRDSFISGSVDFIYGGGDALFEDCHIESVESGFVAAPSGKKDWVGFVFLRSSFTSRSLPESSVFLMRPWRPEGKSRFISCSFGPHIDKRGRCEWIGADRDESTFAVIEAGSEDAESILAFFRS